MRPIYYMSIPAHICSEVGYTSCSLFKLNNAKYASGTIDFIGIDMYAPYTIALLLITVLCAIRMIFHVNGLYASIGRGEMRTIFVLYIIANTLLIFSLALKDEDDELMLILNMLHLSCESVTWFSLFVSSMTIDKIYGIMMFNSANFMRIVCSIYFGVVLTATLVCTLIKNEYIILLLFIFNTLSILGHLYVHVMRLRKMNGEIWGYGVLWITFLFYGLSVAHHFYGALHIALLTNRNLDSLFFITLYKFVSIMMIHKFWLTTCDFELECLTLPV